jgi:hypothetical protein
MYMTFSPGQPNLQGAYILGFPLENVLDVRNPRVWIPESQWLAYPNPFNAETSIPYRVWRDGPVSVRVYDLLGRNVATLVNEARPAGDYVAHWSAHDLPSGIYLAKVETQDVTRVQKLVMLK